MYYTLGQRQGLEVGGIRGASEAPWYVATKDLERNVLVVVQDHDHPLLMSGEFETAPAHWVDGRPPAGRFDAPSRPDTARRTSLARSRFRPTAPAWCGPATRSGP